MKSMENVKVILGHAQGEITEKKSRFIANVFEIHSDEDAMELLEAMRKKYYDARHNCYAYTLGTPNSGKSVQRFSDDGEPSGTAGKPILEVITRQEYQNVLIVVTRYFGGVLLGTGGLSRAYSEASQEGLRAAREAGLVSPLYQGVEASLRCDYNLVGKLQYIMNQMDIPIVSTDYAQDVAFQLIIPTETIQGFSKKITEATSASASLIVGQSISYILKDGIATAYHL